MFQITGKGFFLSLISAILLILSFPRFDYELLAWFALIPLLVALKERNLRWAFILSFITGITFFAGVFYWINIVNGFRLNDFILCIVYLGCYFGLFGLGFNFISNKSRLPPILTAPALWVSLEYLRSHAGILSLPWALLGHSQYLNLPIIQISTFTGVYGVSFLIVMANAALSGIMLSHAKDFKPVLITSLILGIVLAYGFIVISGESERSKISITVIQGNLPHDLRWGPAFQKENLEKHLQLTKEAVNAGRASIIVWPEVAAQGSLTHDLYLWQSISNLAKETDAYLLIGSADRPKFGQREFKKKRRYNSAFLISPRGSLDGQYNKIRLTPFGEYLPYENFLPWPSRFVSNSANFISGKEYTIFNLNDIKFGITICWENIFPDHFRKFVKQGANFMINITNEAWFGETAAPYQFLMINVFRAVENRVSIVRSAYTGISSFIDPHGRIIGRIKDNNKDTFVEGYLTKEIPLSKGKAFYTIYGDIFAYINLIMAGVLLAISFFIKNKYV